MVNCSNFTCNAKSLEQTVNNEGKNILEPFQKSLKVVLLYSIKTVVSHLKLDVYGKRHTANDKNETFAVSLQLCVQWSEIICICNKK